MVPAPHFGQPLKCDDPSQCLASLLSDPLYHTQNPPTDEQQAASWSYSCCVLVFMPDCSSLKPPPRSRLPDQTIAAVQVLTPVTWGFTFANHRPSSQLSMFTLLPRGRISDAGVCVRLLQCSAQWDELPNCTDTPIVRLAASPAACNGVVAARVCPNVSIVAIPSRTISERGLCYVIVPKALQREHPCFPPVYPPDYCLFLSRVNPKPEPWM